jgi:hypothetical protein
MTFRSGERNSGEHIENISLFTARFKRARREALTAFGAFAAAAPLFVAPAPAGRR